MLRNNPKTNDDWKSRRKHLELNDNGSNQYLGRSQSCAFRAICGLFQELRLHFRRLEKQQSNPNKRNKGYMKEKWKFNLLEQSKQFCF